MTKREKSKARRSSSFEKAIQILTPAKIITAKQAALAWKVKTPCKEPIYYSEDYLHEAAEENRSKGSDWRLVYYLGHSLRSQREKLGTNRNFQPCFFPDHRWLQQSEDYWAEATYDTGYNLINFNGRFPWMSWYRQEAFIQDPKPHFCRAPEAVISEAIVSILNITGERLLKNWYHWGPSCSSSGDYIAVGDFDINGIKIEGYRPDWYRFGVLRVCLLKNRSMSDL